jgi:hypothetical protein
MMIVVCGSGIAGAGDGGPAAAAPTSSTQNVNVVNTPTVNVGNTPAVTISGTPAVSANVSNTKANPLPSEDVEKLARVPYSSLVSATSCSGSALCGMYIGPVPTGYRLVVRHVSAQFQLPLGTTAPPLLDLYAYNANPKGHWLFVGKIGPTIGSTVYSAVNEDVLAYFDPIDGPGIDTFGAPGFREITVTGYLENCTITGCPPIQQ